MKKATILAAAFLIAMAVQASAHRGDGIEVEILSDSGQRYSSIPHRNFTRNGILTVKQYLEAKRDRTYTIVVWNRTAGRICIVAAVDGRNVISGKKSDLGRNEEMYLIEPYGVVTIDGWRTAQNTVHGFYFTRPERSYSVTTFGDSSAMGVIAVAAYAERVRRPIQKRSFEGASQPGGARDSASAEAPSPSSKAQKSAEATGTGFGEERYSPAVKVEFDPAGVPFQKTLVKYEWTHTLCKKGILRCSTSLENRLWDEGEYAPFPPGYSER